MASIWQRIYSRLRPLLTWRVVAGLAGLAIVALGFFWVRSEFNSNAKTEDLSVEAQWNRTISSLGIDPVYPPQEDVAVGDVFAVVSVREPDENPSSALSDTRYDKLAEEKPFIGRSVKLAHIPVQNELRQAYAEMPFFPSETGDTPSAQAAGAGGNTATAAQPGDVFDPAKRTVLPRAAFPGISITFKGQAGLGGKGAGGLFGFGASRDSEQTVQLKSVETYGLPSVVAAALLEKFCADASSHDICTERTARKHLLSIFDHVMETKSNPNLGLIFAYPVKLIMISRVYYAHDIVEVSSADSENAASGTLQLTAKPAVVDALPTHDAGTGANPAALEAEIDDLKHRLDSVEQGVAAQYRIANGHRISLDETSTRPIAFGYRSVVYDYPQQDRMQPF